MREYKLFSIHHNRQASLLVFEQWRTYQIESVGETVVEKLITVISIS